MRKVLIYFVVCAVTVYYVDGKRRTYCPKLQVFNSRCPRGIVLINMDDFQNTIIGIHNKFRNDLANGYVDGLYRARGLPEVVWDKELEDGARRNVLQCNYKKDSPSCRNSINYPHTGQNIYYASGLANLSSDVETPIVHGIKSWWLEHKNIHSYKLIKAKKKKLVKKPFKQFTVMANYKSCRIGCGASRTDNDFYLVCNYSYDNVRNTAVYFIKSRSELNCKTKSKHYLALCANSDVIDFT